METKKMVYEPAKIEVIEFETEDVITTSGVGDNPGTDDGFSELN